MVDFNKLMGSITGSGMGAGLAGGVAGGALVSALGSKSGRKAAKSVAKVGGLAAVGALAWSAYKKYQGDSAAPAQVPAQTAAAPIPAPTQVAWQQLPQEQFDSLSTAQADSQGLLVLRTMIAAAMADGHLGPQEQVRIFERLDELGLSAEERSMLFDELRNPLSCQALAAQATDPVLAIELYTAAVMTLDLDCVAGQSFLHELSRGMNLPDALTASIHNNVAAGQLEVA